jgi:predicted metalloprotease
VRNRTYDTKQDNYTAKKMAGAALAQANFILNNDIKHDDDILYRFDKDEQKRVLEERPWKNEYVRPP